MASISRRKTKTGYSWTARVDIGPDSKTGKRRQKRLSARTRKDLEAKIAELQHASNTGGYVEATRLTLKDYLETEWLPTAARTVRPSTIRVYSREVRNHIVPALGRIQMGRLAPVDVQQFYTDKLDQGLSPTTVRKLHAILHRALADAMRLGRVGRNVCQFVQAPAAARVEMRTWSASEARQFLTATQEHKLGLFWHLGLLTGMRAGELIALRWMDIDARRLQLAVRLTLTTDADGSPAFGPPKSGERVVSLPVHLIGLLDRARFDQQERFDAMGLEWTTEALVFDRDDSRAHDPKYVSHHFHLAARRVGVPDIRLHDLRHTAATLMAAGSIHTKIIQERLGHHSAAFTLDRYAHVTESMQAQAAAQYAEMLGFEAECDQIVTEAPVRPDYFAPES